MKKLTLLEWIVKQRLEIGLVVLIMLIDQTVKLFVTFNLLSHSINRGVAFSFLEGNFRFALILNILGFLALTVLIIKAFAQNSTFSRAQKILLAIIYGAGLSNLIDRVVRGGVVDFINLPYIPSFNLADLLITVSTVLFLVLLFIKK